MERRKDGDINLPVKYEHERFKFLTALEVAALIIVKMYLENY